MTTVALQAPEVPVGTAPPLRTRIANVVRLQLANPWTPIITPVLILSVIFVASFAMWLIIAANTEPDDVSSFNSGGVMFVLVYMLVIAAQTMNSTFPFALGYGVTRRDFYLGSSALFTLLAAGYSAGLMVLAVIERETGGWGLKAQFYAPTYLGELNAVQYFYVYFTLLLFFFFTGAAVAAVYVRWRTSGMLTFFGGLVVAIVLAMWFLMSTQRLEAVGRFFVNAGLLGTLTWSLAVSAVMAVAGYLVLRRATPRN
jgi:hypothetical protein